MTSKNLHLHEKQELSMNGSSLTESLFYYAIITCDEENYTKQIQTSKTTFKNATQTKINF